MRLSDVISRVRLDAGDVDAERYTDVHIVDMVNEGLCEIFNVRPDLFAKTVVVRLDEGELQQPCCCTQVQAVEALTDGNGVKVADIRKVDVSALSAFGKRRCRSAPGLPSEYWLPENGGRKFMVSPPVKPGQRVFARLLCAVRPRKLPFEGDMPFPHGCAFYGALLDFVLFRLFATETESASSAQKSALYYRMFYEKLGLHERVRRAFAEQERKEREQ